MEKDNGGESLVSQASIASRAEALEKLEATKEKVPETKAEEKPEAKEPVKLEEKPEGKEPEKKIEATKTEEKPLKPVKEKKEANDPEEMRKWNTRVSQENKKLRDEMQAIKEAQDKTYKLLASLSKKPIDYKELAKTPEALEKFVAEERDAVASEYQEQLEKLATQAKEKDTIVEKMRREQDSENYPRWKELYPQIVKIAIGPTGQGDPRVDFTKPASEVLDHLYEIAQQENPKGAEPVTEPVQVEKTFTEAEVKAMVADMVSKERDSISKTAREEAAKEAQEALRLEAAGSTVASAGKGAGRVPTDHLQAFKKMSLGEQRDWLIAQQNNNQ